MKTTANVSVFAVIISFCLVAGCSLEQSQISSERLRELWPELKNPRLMAEEDLPGENAKRAFRDYSYSFTIAGDFNLDATPDLAIAGHFDNPSNPEDQSFFAILEKKQGKWMPQYFFRPKSGIVVLSRTVHPDMQKKAGYPAIIAQFTAAPSDDYGLVFWNGRKYDALSGFDPIYEETQKMGSPK